MAHELDLTLGTAAFAYTGKAPWHGLGHSLPPGQPIEVWREKAGMLWNIARSRVQYNVNGEMKPFEGRVVLYRDDTGAPLGDVSDGFKIVQPNDILQFQRELCEAHGLTMETAGVLRGGRRFFALAKTGTAIETGTADRKDPALLYVLIATAADGTMSTVTLPTGVRVVCANTWRQAIGENGEKAGKGNRYSHRSVFNADEARHNLGFEVGEAASAFERHGERLRELEARRVKETEAAGFFRALLRPKAEEKPGEAAKPVPAEPKRDPRGLDSLLTAYHAAPGALPGTARGLWEATTYFLDHQRGTDREKRLDSAWLGQGAEMKERAWTMLENLVDFDKTRATLGLADIIAATQAAQG